MRSILKEYLPLVRVVVVPLSSPLRVMVTPARAVPFRVTTPEMVNTGRIVKVALLVSAASTLPEALLITTLTLAFLIADTAGTFQSNVFDPEVTAPPAILPITGQVRPPSMAYDRVALADVSVKPETRNPIEYVPVLALISSPPLGEMTVTVGPVLTPAVQFEGAMKPVITNAEKHTTTIQFFKFDIFPPIKTNFREPLGGIYA